MSRVSNLKVKIVGVGGAGGNFISGIKERLNLLKEVESIAINTDLQDLRAAKADLKIPIGEQTTQGLGAGMNPQLGKKALLESKEKVIKVLEDSELVILIGGLGGGTGTGALPQIAKLLKTKEILTLAFVTLPFSFEGGVRKKIAKKGLKELYTWADATMVIENDKLLELSKNRREILIREAFGFSDEIVFSSLESILELLNPTGLITLSFENIREALKEAGSFFIGRAKSSGEDKIEKALKLILSSPFSPSNLKTARHILFSLASKGSITLKDIDKFTQVLVQKKLKDTKIAFSILEDPSLKKEEVRLTLLLAGF